MEIGWPTDVRHVAHVTFDRLQGFLGLPVKFELDIPGQVPSASLFFKQEMELSLVGLQNAGKKALVNSIATGGYSEDMIPTVCAYHLVNQPKCPALFLVAD